MLEDGGGGWGHWKHNFKYTILEMHTLNKCDLSLVSWQTGCSLFEKTVHVTVGCILLAAHGAGKNRFHLLV